MLTHPHSRRDGSPFMNLLMTAPLLDSRGTLRYFIGAQIDVSGLVKDCTDLNAFQRMLDEQEGNIHKEEAKDEFQELSEMFNNVELDTVRKHGGNMHRDHVDEQDDKASIMGRPRLLIKDQSTLDVEDAERPLPKADGRLSGPYKHVSLRTCVAICEMERYTDYEPSTSSCVPRHHCAFCSHRRAFACLASSSRPSSTASAAATASASRFATRYPTGLAA
jgi:hypothetical protein